MAMTKGDGATGPAAGRGAGQVSRVAEPAPAGARVPDAAGPAPGERRSHVPGAGTPAAEAVERARRDMLHEGNQAHR